MKISEIMSRDVKLASPDDTLQQAARMMREADTGALPVSENDRLVGMITDRDLTIRALAEGKGPNTKVREVMSEGVKYVFEDQTTEEVAQNMGDLQIRRFPVVNRDKRLVGVVSLGDLAVRDQAMDEAGAALSEVSEKPGRSD
ncbi:MAG TPA: CBS domain-containing protein [Azospirillaceae bacterium]|nr:CBS domain-containing protein [Azospirillaceae bacterium]